MAMDSLVKFSTDVIKTAEKSRDEKLESFRNTEKEREQSSGESIKSESESRVRVECEKISLEAERSTAKLKSGLKAEIYKRREEMFDEIFSEVLKNIEEYKKSADYIKNTQNELIAAIAAMGDGKIICRCLKEDEEMLKKAESALVFEEADEDIIGGFSLMNKEKNLFLDMTLKSRIEEQKKKFYKKSGLVLNQ